MSIWPDHLIIYARIQGSCKVPHACQVRQPKMAEGQPFCFVFFFIYFFLSLLLREAGRAELCIGKWSQLEGAIFKFGSLLLPVNQPISMGSWGWNQTRFFFLTKMGTNSWQRIALLPSITCQPFLDASDLRIGLSQISTVFNGGCLVLRVCFSFFENSAFINMPVFFFLEMTHLFWGLFF